MSRRNHNFTLIKQGQRLRGESRRYPVGWQHMSPVCVERREASGSSCIHTPTLCPPPRSKSGQCPHSAKHGRSLHPASGNIHAALWPHLHTGDSRDAERHVNNSSSTSHMDKLTTTMFTTHCLATSYLWSLHTGCIRCWRTGSNLLEVLVVPSSTPEARVSIISAFLQWNSTGDMSPLVTALSMALSICLL